MPFTARFDREARAIAAFNHPNICTLYDVGPNYLVMELIDGTRDESQNPARRPAALVPDLIEGAFEVAAENHADLLVGIAAAGEPVG
jgi:hypothetical protein